MKEIVEIDRLATMNETSLSEELAGKSITCARDQKPSVGMKMRTGIKSGPRIMVRRRRVYIPTNIP